MVIKMRTVEGNPKLRQLLEPLPYLDFHDEFAFVPEGFVWNGSSVPIGLLVMLNAVGMAIMMISPRPWVAVVVMLITFIVAMLPRHQHPIASCIHDYQCAIAKNAAERRKADIQYFGNTLKTSCDDLPRYRQAVHYVLVFISAVIGYVGVRIGAMFKVGSNY